MQTAAISYRVADFLKQHPPFQTMEEADLLAPVEHRRVRVHESDEPEALTRFLAYVKDGVIVGHHTTLKHYYRKRTAHLPDASRSGVSRWMPFAECSAGDAFLTAQIFQRLLRLAAEHGPKYTAADRGTICGGGFARLKASAA